VALFSTLIGLAVWAPAAAAPEDQVLIADVRGVITPVIADHLRSAVDRAESTSQALLVTLDTPGGLDTAMRDIVQAFLSSKVPVIVYVSPPGARAASAGAIITLAAHVAAMAPGTNIGAATPVDLQGGQIGEKVINDAAAYVRALAELRGRDATFYVQTVRQGRSASAEEALTAKAVDLIASSRTDLLRTLDGRRIGSTRLDTRGVELVRYDLDPLGRVRQRLADPTLAFLFLSLGALLIVVELSHPGVGAAGVVGAILLLLAFFGLQVLPTTGVGVLLVFLAIALFVAEVFVPGVGVPAAGGAVSLALAGVFLVRGPVRASLPVVVTTAVLMFAAVIVVGRIAWRTRRAPTHTGHTAVTGRLAEVRRADGSTGQVLIDGAWWTVRAEQPLNIGQNVRVKEMDGLVLVVEPEGGSGE
jgi:membrane-bound serine protease (ClpP class)